MALVYITRRVHFNAAHKMENPAWSAERNQEVFGPCANKNWHGHNYEMEVTLQGQPHPDTGYVMDLVELTKIIDREVVSHLDHKNLNLDVPFLSGIMASSENVVVAIWQRLAPHIPPPAKLWLIRLWETPRNSVEYRGE
jgi:6-pyruvoyltetrahydropterin/6-carboxytetrahydropterin synthase